MDVAAILTCQFSKSISISNVTNIKIQNYDVKLIDEYKYLDHTLRLRDESQKNVIGRRIGPSWEAFGKLNFIFPNTMDMIPNK